MKRNPIMSEVYIQVLLKICETFKEKEGKRTIDGSLNQDDELIYNDSSRASQYQS
jgi:hypothetical protein